MSDAGVMTTSIVAVDLFSGKIKATCTFLKKQGYIPKMLDKSRLNRRQQRIAE